MKKLSLTIVLGLLLNTLHSHAQKITIIEQDYERAKVESKKQHKLILIDFYTTWCVPCKELDELIFKDTIVTNQIAKNFIVLKYDAEKDKEHQLSLKHHILSYPTTLILNEEQRVLNRAYGHPGEGRELVKNYFTFLDESVAKNLSNDYIKGVSSENHLDYPKFYQDYVYRIDVKNHKPALINYWQNTSDYYGEVPFAILCYFGGGTDEVNDFFLRNKNKYKELYGSRDVDFIISMLASEKAYKAIETKDRVLFATAMKLSKENFSEKQLGNYFTIMEEKMLQAEGRWPEAAKSIALRKKQPDFGEWAISSFSWEVVQKCNDLSVLQKCSEWMKELTDKKPTYATLDTYAQLLAKTGKKNEAVVAMKRAISIGKSTQENTQSSEDWLKKNNF
ncbi:MAG: thioredoxin family protein [Flavobacterium sp.]|nr:MAG: thioredoxin family protein [Flavobacterium sp.]